MNHHSLQCREQASGTENNVPRTTVKVIKTTVTESRSKKLLLKCKKTVELSKGKTQLIFIIFLSTNFYPCSYIARASIVQIYPTLYSITKAVELVYQLVIILAQNVSILVLLKFTALLQVASYCAPIMPPISDTHYAR